MTHKNKLIALSAFLLVAALVAWWALAPSPARAPATIAPPDAPVRAGSGPEKVIPPPSLTSARETETISATEPVTAPAPTTRTVGDIVGDDSLNDHQASLALREIVADGARTLEVREEALQHLLNLSINDPEKYLTPLVQDPRLPVDLIQIILADSFNTPPQWQASAHLAILAHHQTPALRDEAKEHLRFLTDEDHGDDVRAWREAIGRARAKWLDGTETPAAALPR